MITYRTKNVSGCRDIPTYVKAFEFKIKNILFIHYYGLRYILRKLI